VIAEDLCGESAPLSDTASGRRRVRAGDVSIRPQQ